MKLNDKWSIEKEGSGFALFEKKYVNITVNGKKTGDKKEGFNKSFYGTVYQALNGFLDKSINESLVDDPDDIFELVHNVVAEINVAKDYIKSEFRTEVRVSR